MLKRLCFTILLFTALQGAASVTTANSVKGYREWKNEKVQIAMTSILSIKGQILKSKTEGNKKNADALEKQLSQTHFNLEVVRDLSVTDYFVLYLSQQAQADRFQQAANKMTTNEVVELMEAYANTLSISAPAEAATQQAVALPAQLRPLPSHALRVRDQLK